MDYKDIMPGLQPTRSKSHSYPFYKNILLQDKQILEIQINE